MSEQEEQKPDRESEKDAQFIKTLKFWLKWIGIAVVALLVFSAIYGFFQFHVNSPSQDPVQGSGYSKALLGTLGDFVGGILNPILSFLTILILLWSIRIQKAELKQAINELANTTQAHKESITNEKASYIYEKTLDELKSKIRNCWETFYSSDHSLYIGKKEFEINLSFLSRYIEPIEEISKSEYVENIEESLHSFLYKMSVDLESIERLVTKYSELNLDPVLWVPKTEVLFRDFSNCLNRLHELNIYIEKEGGKKYIGSPSHNWFSLKFGLVVRYDALLAQAEAKP